MTPTERGRSPRPTAGRVAWSGPRPPSSGARSCAQRATFSVTELEAFADCSQRWFVERQIDPKSVDAEPDALLRGQIAHQALHRFYTGLPRELGGPERV